MNVSQLLGHVGLNHFESQIYQYLLTQDQVPASQVSLQLKIPRSTVRNTLDKFCSQGLAQKLYLKNTQYYRCLSPEKLIKKLEQDQKKTQANISLLQDNLSQLQLLQQAPKTVPRVQVFQGLDQVIEAFNLSLFAEPQEILICTSYQFFTNPKFKKNDDEVFVKMRVERNIPARVIVGYSQNSKTLPAKSKAHLRERRLLPKQFQIPGNLHIYNDCVLYFSVEETEPLAVLTQSELLANTMRNMFEFMWQQSH